MTNVRKIEVREATFEVDDKTINAIVIPIAAQDIQLVLTDEIGEAIAVAYISEDGKIRWKFNEPVGKFKEVIESKLREAFLKHTETVKQPVLKCYRKIAIRYGSLITFDEEGNLIGFPLLADGTVSLSEKFYIDFIDGLEDLLQQ